MTAYAACIPAAATPKLTITPSSTYQMRIARVEVFGNCSGPSSTAFYSLSLYPANTPTSGTTVTPVAMVSGSPATTVTAKSGATISGTNAVLHSEAVALGGGASGGDIGPMNSNYTFPFELILSSGATLLVSGGGTSASLAIAVYYEEIRTSRTL